MNCVFFFTVCVKLSLHWHHTMESFVVLSFVACRIESILDPLLYQKYTPNIIYSLWLFVVVWREGGDGKTNKCTLFSNSHTTHNKNDLPPSLPFNIYIYSKTKQNKQYGPGHVHSRDYSCFTTTTTTTTTRGITTSFSSTVVATHRQSRPPPCTNVSQLFI